MKIFRIQILLLLLTLVFFASKLDAQIWEIANGTHRSTQIIPAGGKSLFSISSRLFFSTNLGNTWQVDNGSFSKDVNGFMIGSSGKFYFSSPLGLFVSPPYSDINNESWTLFDTTGLPHITSIFVRADADSPGEDEMFAGTSKGLWRRRHSDNSWKKIHDAEDGAAILQITAFHKNIYYRTEHDAYATYDDGATWNNIHDVPGNFSISSIVTTSDSDVFLATRSAKSDIIHSAHRGADDWSGFKGLNLGDATFNTLLANESGDLYLGGNLHDALNPDSITQGLVWRFLHDDSQWRPFSDGLPINNVIGLGFSSAGKVFAGTDSLGLWRTLLPNSVRKLNEQNGITLSDNFPNPANSSTQFTVFIDHTINASVSLFDALGRNIQNISNGSLSSGTHLFTVDTKNLPVGAYFYRLQTGEVILSKAFIVAR